VKPWHDVPVISRLEAAMSLAMAALFVCLLADWDTGGKVAGLVFLALAFVFTARLVYRKSHGASWADAWGRTPRDST
jgi:hypothetical protein